MEVSLVLFIRRTQEQGFRSGLWYHVLTAVCSSQSRTDNSMNKKCFYKWTIMFLSLDHSNWNSREINWNNIRRKSHYSWRKRVVWPNSSWRMARRSKRFQITPIQVHSLCNANSHDSRHPESAINALHSAFIVLTWCHLHHTWQKWFQFNRFINTCDSCISQTSSSAAQKETLPRSASGQDRHPDSQPGAHGGFRWYHLVLFKGVKCDTHCYIVCNNDENKISTYALKLHLFDHTYSKK